MACIPGIQCCMDYDIVLEVGHHHERGDPLTLKRLLLLNLASVATVRRHLARLVAEGVVLKETSQTDQRIVMLTPSAATTAALQEYLEQARSVMLPQP